jgi:hypothetical protein
MAGVSDTSLEAERVLVEVYRRLSPREKWLQLGRMYEDARALHAAGMRLRNPSVTSREITEAWIRTNLGIELPVPVRDNPQDAPMANLRDFSEVARILDQLAIPYALGGSMACSVYGMSRQTNDADIMAEPFSGKEEQLIAALGPDYYVSPAAMKDAIRKRSSFNLINTSTGFKVDVFIRPDGLFEQSAMARRVLLDVSTVPDQKICVFSAEDVVLFKLQWYRLGNETSEQQWKDVLAMLKTQQPHLDQAYLARWAALLGVDDLLERACCEVEGVSS